jgi:hypothetical protein
MQYLEQPLEPIMYRKSQQLLQPRQRCVCQVHRRIGSLLCVSCHSIKFWKLANWRSGIGLEPIKSADSFSDQKSKFHLSTWTACLVLEMFLFDAFSSPCSAQLFKSLCRRILGLLARPCILLFSRFIFLDFYLLRFWERKLVFFAFYRVLIFKSGFSIEFSAVACLKWEYLNTS